MSPKAENEGSVASAGKKKGFQKRASGAIANIGSVLRGGVSGGDQGVMRRLPRDVTKASSNMHDLTPHEDAGTQEKMSPTSPPKEKFFNKTWRNRLKVIPNAGQCFMDSTGKLQTAWCLLPACSPLRWNSSLEEDFVLISRVPCDLGVPRPNQRHTLANSLGHLLRNACQQACNSCINPLAIHSTPPDPIAQVCVGSEE